MHYGATGRGGSEAGGRPSWALAALLALAVALIVWPLSFAVPARAAESVALRGLQVNDSAQGARIALLVTRAVSFDARVLAAPLRLEMVVPGVMVKRSPRLQAPGVLVKGVRTRSARGGVVLTFPLRVPALIAGAHAERAVAGRPARLVVRLQRTDAATLAAMLGVPESRLRQEPRSPSGVATEKSRSRPRAAPGEDADAVKAAFRRLVEQAAAIPATIDDLIRAAPLTFGAAEDDGSDGGDAPATAAVAGAPSNEPANSQALSSVAAPVIVVDAGHGGRDPGAVDGKGRKEKDIVLKFAHALRKALIRRGYRVVMTRTGDTFLKLRERSAVARRHHAALFVSIHADKFRKRGVSGLGIYTLSEKASDEDAAELARKENAADLIGAPEPELEDDAVRDILVELTQRETNANSHLLAQRLVRSLKGVVRLRRNPVRSAAFRVLRLPEIPSLLIELGYITNPRDVRDMLSPAWRKKAAARMAETIDRFLKTRLARN